MEWLQIVSLVFALIALGLAFLSLHYINKAQRHFEEAQRRLDRLKETKPT